MISVSVVIPTHKRPALLKRAIQSVLDQTLQPMEIIIVDDASCAESEAIVKGFSNDLLRYIHNEDGQGASSSRNLGVRSANGDFIAFLDDDDAFYPEKIEIVGEEIKANTNTHVFYHPARINMVNEKVFYYTKPCSLDFHGFEQMLISNKVGGTPMIIASREALINAGLFDESLPALEDYELWLRLAKQNKKFTLINQPLTDCYYYTGKQSVSKILDANIAALEKIRNKYSAEYNQLTPKQIKEHQCWERKIMVHKSLLNKNNLAALKKQFSLLYFSPSVFNLASLLVMLLGSKAVFMLKAKVN